MKKLSLIQVSGMILLAAILSLALLAVISALQSTNLLLTLATVSWNGTVTY